MGSSTQNHSKQALRPNTRLVSVMAANNVVGTLQPIGELAQITKAHGALFHTDAVQAVGKIPLHMDVMPVDFLSLSAHKLHGPKGIGALYIRKGVVIEPLVHGGGQERGIRSATENVAAIAGLGKAAEIAGAEMNEEAIASRQIARPDHRGGHRKNPERLSHRTSLQTPARSYLPRLCRPGRRSHPPDAGAQRRRHCHLHRQRVQCAQCRTALLHFDGDGHGPGARPRLAAHHAWPLQHGSRSRYIHRSIAAPDGKPAAHHIPKFCCCCVKGKK